MVELFPFFCEKIDNGDFYIACAMGLHRTDIALCTYWVFYAADKGIAPPPIRGYRQEELVLRNFLIGTVFLNISELLAKSISTLPKFSKSIIKNKPIK